MSKIQNIVVISDTHFGCQLGLCPPKVKLDNGGVYNYNKIQEKIWKHWLYFWKVFVPEVTQNKDFIVVHNGDVIDGVHHRTTTQISHNLVDQENIAVEVMSIIKDNPKCKKLFFLRGTEAHSGPSAESEERIAERLKADKNEQTGNYTRYILWLRFGKNVLAQFAHHISTTNSAAYESTAVYKEQIELFTDSGRYKLEPPDIVVRSHRHRFLMTITAGKNENSISVVTPGWQAITPFAYRGSRGRTGLAQVGGIVIKEGSEVPLYVRHSIIALEREKEVQI